MEVAFRDATPEDARLLAWTMLSAIGFEPTEELLSDGLWLREDILYSYTRARVVTVDGKPAGCLISYPGEDYAGLRVKTWQLIFGETSEDADKWESETFPGEYYLDSMAVLPEFRGMHLGRELLLDGIAKGRRAGYGRVTLLVESDRPGLRDYYASVGFEPGPEMDFFGHTYTRMAVTAK